MSNHDFRHRAEMGQLWYDDLREQYGFTAEHLKDAMIFDIATRASGDVRQLKEKLADAGGLPNTDRLNRTLPAPIGDGSQVDAICEATAVAHARGDVSTDLLGEYARYAQAAALYDLIGNSSPAEVLVSDKKLINSVLAASRGKYDAMDVWHVPFARCWWEFSTPVRIADVDVKAAAFFCRPELNLGIGALLSKKAVLYAAYSWGVCHGITTGCADLPFQIEREAECLQALGRLWDFVTARNISYEVVRRGSGRIKQLEGRYRHTQGKHCQALRHLMVLGVNRTIKVRDPDSEHKLPPGHDWAFRTLVPGSFHRWVYCDRCGDVHRHDLIGSPCRKCGEVVGPRANIRVEKYWHEPHYRGPDDAPLKEAVRVIQK